MGLEDTICDACRNLVEKKHNQSVVKRFLIYEIFYYSVMYLDDVLYEEEHKKWINELNKKYGDFIKSKEWDEYYNSLVEIAGDVDDKMWEKYYDIIWKDFDDLPLNDFDELYEIIDNRVYSILDEIGYYLQQNYDYFNGSFFARSEITTF